MSLGSHSTVAGSKGLKSTSKPEKTDLDLIGDLKPDIKYHTSTSEPQKTDQDKNSGREIEIAFCPSQDGFRPSQDGLRSCEPGCELASQSFAAASKRFEATPGTQEMDQVWIDDFDMTIKCPQAPKFDPE